MLSDLEAFQAVLVWSVGGYVNGIELGNALADYADEGGGVVQAVPFDAGGSGLGGRWSAEAYSVFSSGATSVEFDPTFTLVQPSHPIVNGVFVPTANGMILFSPGDLQGGSELIAVWDFGKNRRAESASGLRQRWPMDGQRASLCCRRSV
jgi:hypothetical protein